MARARGQKPPQRPRRQFSLNFGVRFWPQATRSVTTLPCSSDAVPYEMTSFPLSSAFRMRHVVRGWDDQASLSALTPRERDALLLLSPPASASGGGGAPEIAAKRAAAPELTPLEVGPPAFLTAAVLFSALPAPAIAAAPTCTATALQQRSTLQQLHPPRNKRPRPASASLSFNRDGIVGDGARLSAERKPHREAPTPRGLVHTVGER